jgi:RNA recognition motif-containing protein
MSNLLLINVPYNVSDREICEWIESRGIGTKSIRVVRDLVTGASPSFGHVELKSSTALKEAISLLDGRRMRNQTIRAKEDLAYA